jgi:hypothetical protein
VPGRRTGFTPRAGLCRLTIGFPTLVHAQEFPGQCPPTRFGAANTHAWEMTV